MQNQNISNSLVLSDNLKMEKYLEQKIKRDEKQNFQQKKWKPYKYLTWEEKKRLSDRETIKDSIKNVNNKYSFYSFYFFSEKL